TFPEDVNGKKPHEIGYAQIRFGPLEYVEINWIRIGRAVSEHFGALGETSIGAPSPSFPKTHIQEKKKRQFQP
ncbi:hypothetical protein LDENG_00105330, partial [Lucifuga dentata]